MFFKHVIELKDIFKTKDRDGTGTLSPDELEECLHLMGLYPTPDEVEFFMEVFDKNSKIIVSACSLMATSYIFATSVSINVYFSC